ncbi:type II/IV secretion system ATPase subunit [Haloglomus litoreum]|uniref:type II/IV secretion system ATPase subunit n=1 Tax=Haloglomus litoreum TaxID=3034026 RepID=UPI0023E8507D|nr:type II/IV secretion system ATPase subunit [Haloglomus sp. DT116]
MADDVNDVTEELASPPDQPDDSRPATSPDDTGDPASSGASPDADAVAGSVLADVASYFEDEPLPFGGDDAPTGTRRWLPFRSDTPLPLDDAPDESFVRDHWFDFGFLEANEIVETYWVRRPFAHVTVVYDPERRERSYHVSEPTLSGVERRVRYTLMDHIRRDLIFQEREEGEGSLTDAVIDQLRESMGRRASMIPPGSAHKVAYYIERDFARYGQLDPLMNDPAIEDISCDGNDVPVYVFHNQYRDLGTNITFEAEQLNSVVIRLAQLADKYISVSEPLVDGSLPDGSRIQLTLGEDVSRRGSNFTIRKFSEVPLTPVELINFGTFSVEEMAYYWLAIENNRSLVFAGGTGSGKTSSMNAVSFFIPPGSKVVSIEDTSEITLPHDNWVQSLTRASISASGRGEVTTYQLLQAALRQRPEYILVGEIRTDPQVAFTFFQAIGTGHTAYTTFHADSIEGVLSRLQNQPLEIPAQMIRELDIVSVQRQAYLGRERVRRTDEVVEILPETTDPGTVETRDVFSWDPETDTHERVGEGESHVLSTIAAERGWSEQELTAEVEARELVLRYLIENDVTEYRPVASTIHMFILEPEEILAAIEDGSFDPYDLPEVT